MARRKTRARPAKRGASRPRPRPSPASDERTLHEPGGMEAGGPFPIVGVGASAGGLEAFSQLLQALPEDPGVALVLVQHLAPQHESALPALLGGVSVLPVVQVEDG